MKNIKAGDRLTESEAVLYAFDLYKKCFFGMEIVKTRYPNKNHDEAIQWMLEHKFLEKSEEGFYVLKKIIQLT